MRLSTEKAIEFVENLEKYHPIQKYWDESNERHRQEKNTENYPYSYFRGVLIRKIAEIIEALQQENEQLVDVTIKLMKENAKNSNKKDELVKVLKQAREALYAARVDVLTKETDELARDAVEAIDALIGGKQDV